MSPRLDSRERAILTPHATGGSRQQGLQEGYRVSSQRGMLVTHQNTILERLGRS